MKIPTSKEEFLSLSTLDRIKLLLKLSNNSKDLLSDYENIYLIISNALNSVRLFCLSENNIKANDISDYLDNVDDNKSLAVLSCCIKDTDIAAILAFNIIINTIGYAANAANEIQKEKSLLPTTITEATSDAVYDAVSCYRELENLGLVNRYEK